MVKMALVKYTWIGSLGMESLLASNTFEMYAPDFRPALPFTPPARTTLPSGRPYVSLRDFVPPLLLRCGPHLFFATLLTGEGLILANGFIASPSA